MKALKFSAATVCVGLLAACATQTQTLHVPPTAEVNVTNDLTHRYGEIQIAQNPNNPNNLVFVQNQMKYTYACQAAKAPSCELVPTRMGGGGGQGAGGPAAGAAAGGQGAGGAARPGAGAPGAGAPGAGAPGAGGGGAGMSDHPKGFFTDHDFDSVGVFVSFDRGNTWKRTTVPVPSPQYPDLHGWGDPSVSAGPNGTFYLTYDNMDWGTADRALPKSILGASKSTDGGITWTSPVSAGTPINGPKNVTDPNTGTVYEASGFGNRQLTSSKDGVTWVKSNGIGGSDGTRTYTPGMGTSMAAAHGMIAFAFRATDAATCTFFVKGAAPCTVFQTSTDTGATWSRFAVPAGAGGSLALAADPSKKDHYTLAVQDARVAKFMVYQTTDGGKTWTGPTTITEDSSKQYYHAWAAYSPNGVFGLVWRSRTPVAGQTAAGTGPAGGGGTPLPYNVWAAISRDGGQTFSAPLKVSTADSPAPQAGNFGNNGDDYSAILLDKEYAYFGWADWRPGDRQGFFRAIKLDAFK